MLKKMFIFVLLFFLIFQLVTPTSITLAENTSKKLTTKATPYADGQTDFPPIPAGVKPIDIGNKFNFTGDGIYQSSFMYEMTGVSMLSSQAWSVARYNLTRPFEIEFYTYLGDATKEGTADGIALAFHNNENFTVGDNGSGMGTYSKDLGKASVLEFDTYYNDAVNSKPTGDHDVDILDETVMNMTTGQPNHVGHVAIRSSDANGNVGTHKLITTGTASAPLANGQ